MSRSKYWIFTYNNPSYGVEEWSDKLAEHCTYFIFQKEKGNSGTIHYQGYAEFETRVTLPTLKKICPMVHWEKRMGTAQECKSYCTKTETRVDGPWEYGQLAETQGARRDLEDIQTMCKEGKSYEEIADKHFGSWIRYKNGITSYINLKRGNKRQWKTHVTIIVGPPGSGKSRYCAEQYPMAYWKDPSDEFWDGYDGHETIILDDYYGWIGYVTMLRLMDRYPMSLNIKGGKVPCMAKSVVITSNTEPDTWYPNIFKRESALTAFMRRVDEIKYMT